jgi:hypothetical protein
MDPFIETAMRPLSFVPTLIALGLLAGCSEQPAGPRPLPGTPPSFAIQDGAHGGSPQFYFLPPMVPAPSYSGTFDPVQSPVVTICVLAGSACGATVTSFSGSAVKLDLAAEAYVASWKTKGAGLDPTKTYRIQVLIGAAVLGYADVVVLSNGSQIKTVDKNQFVSVINGGVLKIRFRIEQAAPPPPPGPWHDGDLVTYNQDSWGGDPTAGAGALLLNRFGFVYSDGFVEVGSPGTAGNSMIFTSVAAVVDYLPASGGPAPLNSDLVDPTSTSSGVFGGYVLALQFDVAFADAGYLAGTSGLAVGDLRLCGLTTTPAYNGMTVRQFLTEMNMALGGHPVAYSSDDIAFLTNDVTLAFEGGTPSSFAQTHLVNGACPGGWQNGELVTYNQNNWGTIGTTASNLLANHFFTVFTNGVVEIGIAGIAGYSAIFSSANAVIDYAPTTGVPGPLANDLFDPTSTSSGVFGGHVLALQIDVTFTDAGLVSGTAPLQFGDLRVCGLTNTPAFNGLTVRQVLAALNTAIGGGAAPYSYDELATLAEELTQSFESGVASSFAQAHLVNGTCPGGWQDGNMTTYSQDQWGDGTTTASNLLANSFATVYFSTGGLLVGLVPTYNMTFDGAQAIFDYQPATGAPAPLNANLSNPTSTASGSFGGEVVALKLNVDFSQNNLLPSSANLRFGDLLICGVNPVIDGGNVSMFLGYANSALGGGSAPLSITEINLIAVQLNASFGGGAVSPFAQAHLVNGACP